MINRNENLHEDGLNNNHLVDEQSEAEMRKIFSSFTNEQITIAAQLYKRLITADNRYDLNNAERTNLFPAVPDYKSITIKDKEQDKREANLALAKEQFSKHKNERFYLEESKETIDASTDTILKIQIIFRILREWKNRVKINESTEIKKQYDDYQRANHYRLHSKLQLKDLSVLISNIIPDCSIKIDEKNNQVSFYDKENHQLLQMIKPTENIARFSNDKSELKNVFLKKNGNYHKTEVVFGQKINFDEYVLDAEGVLTPRYIVRAITPQERTVLATHSINAGLLPQGMSDELTGIEKEALDGVTKDDLQDSKTKSAITQRLGTRRVTCVAALQKNALNFSSTSNSGEQFFKPADEYMEYLAATPTRQTPAQYRYEESLRQQEKDEKQRLAKEAQKNKQNQKKKVLTQEEKEELKRKHLAANAGKKNKLNGAADLTASANSLANSSTDLTSSNNSLASSSTDLASSNNSLASSRTDLASSRADLASSRADLASSNNSLAGSINNLASSNNNSSRANNNSAKGRIPSDILPQVQGGGLVLIDLAKVPSQYIHNQYKLDAVTNLKAFQKGKNRNLQSYKENENKESMHANYKNREIHLDQISPNSIMAWTPKNMSSWTREVTLPKFHNGDIAKIQDLTIEMINKIEERTTSPYQAFIKPPSSDETKVEMTTNGFGLFDKLSNDSKVIQFRFDETIDDQDTDNNNFKDGIQPKLS